MKFRSVVVCVLEAVYKNICRLLDILDQSDVLPKNSGLVAAAQCVGGVVLRFAAMTLAKNPAPIEVINDINGDIVNFFRQLQKNTAKLKRLVYLTSYARAEHELAKKQSRSSLTLREPVGFLLQL